MNEFENGRKLVCKNWWFVLKLMEQLDRTFLSAYFKFSVDNVSRHRNKDLKQNWPQLSADMLGFKFLKLQMLWTIYIRRWILYLC